MQKFKSGPWGMTLGLVLTLSAIGLGFASFPVLHRLLPAGLPEGILAGWSWSLSLIWMVGTVRHGQSGTVREIAGRDAEGLQAKSIALCGYFLSAFTLLGVVECAQLGAPAVMGFALSACIAATLFGLASVVCDHSRDVAKISSFATAGG